MSSGKDNPMSTGRVCSKHEEWCPEGICRWCEPLDPEFEPPATPGLTSGVAIALTAKQGLPSVSPIPSGTFSGTWESVWQAWQNQLRQNHTAAGNPSVIHCDPTAYESWTKQGSVSTNSTKAKK